MSQVNGKSKHTSLVCNKFEEICEETIYSSLAEEFIFVCVCVCVCVCMHVCLYVCIYTVQGLNPCRGKTFPFSLCVCVCV